MSNFYGDVLPGTAPRVMNDGQAEVFVASRIKGGIDGWETRYVAKGIWELRPNIDATYHNKIPMTGNAVETICRIPTAFRLIRLEWKHLSDTLVDDTTATAAIMYRDDNKPISNLRWRLYYEAASASSTTLELFGEGYEYGPADLILSFNTTNGHWIAPIIYIQELKP
jgi:hypothetical protein